MKLNKLLYFFFFFFISCVLSKTKDTSKPNDISLINSKIESFLLKDSIFNNDESKFIIIYNSINCKDCFRKIDTSLQTYKLKNNNIKIFVITTANNKNATRYLTNQAKKKITSADNVFFEIAKQESLFEYSYPKDGIFVMYNIDITPCILRIKNGEVKYFSYSSIFGNKTYSEDWLK